MAISIVYKNTYIYLYEKNLSIYLFFNLITIYIYDCVNEKNKNNNNENIINVVLFAIVPFG